MDDTRPEPAHDLELLYDIARSRLDTQLAFLDSLDSKLALYLSVGAAVETIAAAVVAVEHSRWSWFGLIALAVSIGGFSWLTYVTLMALRLGKWGIGPKVGPIAAAIKRHGNAEARRRAIKTLMALFDENSRAYDTKAAAVPLAAIGLAIQTVAAALALASVAGRPS